MNKLTWCDFHRIQFKGNSQRTSISPTMTYMSSFQTGDKPMASQDTVLEKTSVIELTTKQLNKIEKEFELEQMRRLLRNEIPEIAEAYSEYMMKLWWYGYNQPR